MSRDEDAGTQEKGSKRSTGVGVRSFGKSPNPEVLHPGVSRFPQTNQSQTQSKKLADDHPCPAEEATGRQGREGPRLWLAKVRAGALGGSFTNMQGNQGSCYRRCEECTYSRFPGPLQKEDKEDPPFSAENDCKEVTHINAHTWSHHNVFSFPLKSWMAVQFSQWEGSPRVSWHQPEG